MLDKWLTHPILDINFLGNTFRSYVYVLILFVVLAVIFHILQSIVFKKLELSASKTKTDIDDAVIKILEGVRPPLYFLLSLHFSAEFIYIHDQLRVNLLRALLIWLTYQGVITLNSITDFLVKKLLNKKDASSKKTAVSLLSNMAKGLWVIMGILIVLSTLGVNVTSLVAGIGIGGLAIALAVQNILTDLFSSFVIYFDKPFEVGDTLIVGNQKGTVEKIGVKTTRLRAANGDEIIIPNLTLTSSILQNLGPEKRKKTS